MATFPPAAIVLILIVGAITTLTILQACAAAVRDVTARIELRDQADALRRAYNDRLARLRAKALGLDAEEEVAPAGSNAPQSTDESLQRAA